MRSNERRKTAGATKQFVATNSDADFDKVESSRSTRTGGRSGYEIFSSVEAGREANANVSPRFD
jgi:hypothetical protein